MVAGIVISLLIAGGGLLAYILIEKNEENNVLQELAELNKQEMEDQYKQFDIQYGELQKQLKNDSLIAQIEEERRHTQQLLEELQNTKASNAAEIRRLKKEIASLREVLQHYIVQVDSLNRLNQALITENTEIKAQYSQATSQINNLSNERNQLKDKVELASQLDATGFWVTPKNKRGKTAKKVKDVKKIAFGFTIAKNVTAKNGQRIIYARILKPDNSILKNSDGTFEYENTKLDYSVKKYIEYNGEEQNITLYWDVEEYLEAGTYKLFIFADKQMIGETSFTLD
ncbi:MAG: hypothetical protein LUD00_07315 [Prevotellaceae bacterium]|nr:hypothetical protein [Prevotellaceae bacterium]